MTEEKYDLTTRVGRFKHFGSVDPIEGTKPTQKEDMKDLQQTKKDFLFAIDHVGINQVKYPVIIDHMQSVGNFSLSTSLTRDEKGINMSRLIESLELHYHNGIELSFESLSSLTESIRTKMKQNVAQVEVKSTWFYDKASPVTQLTGRAHAQIGYTINKDENNEDRKFYMQSDVTTLCPCSKEISEYSAHNQRGTVTVSLDLYNHKDIPKNHKEIVLEIMEANASSQLYPILKRTDEKKVTERAYENPRFVEDILRLIAYDLVELDWVKGFTLICENKESIHQHDAYSRLTYNKE